MAEILPIWRKTLKWVIGYDKQENINNCTIILNISLPLKPSCGNLGHVVEMLYNDRFSLRLSRQSGGFFFIICKFFKYREFFNHMKAYPYPVKGSKFEPILGAFGNSSACHKYKYCDRWHSFSRSTSMTRAGLAWHSCFAVVLYDLYVCHGWDSTIDILHAWQ